MFSLGDRVRWSTMGDDGLPLVRYGFVGGVASDAGPVVVMRPSWAASGSSLRKRLAIIAVCSSGS